MNPIRLLTTVLLFLIGFFPESSKAQNLLKSRKTSPYTYYYKITDDEAREIYKKDLCVVDSSFFHTRVDSSLTDSSFVPDLPHGHYLRTYAKEHLQKFEITSVNPFDIIVLNNTSDLSLRVYNKEGELLKDAKLMLKGSRIAFDEETQSFVKKKNNRKGLIEVEYEGFSAFFQLDRAYKNSASRRFFRKVFVRSPIRYVWYPIYFVGRLPLDGFRSIKSRYPQGSIRGLVNFVRRSFDRLACMFDEYYCDDLSYKFSEKYTGYFIFNKPKYRPGDTVKLKAFISHKNGKAVNKELGLYLYNKKDIKLGTISPYSKGGYVFEFPLHDSLELTLDRDYLLEIRNKEHQVYIGERFRYEDYELQESQLAIRLSGEEQFAGESLSAYVKATDANGLQIQDGRLEVIALRSGVSEFKDDHVFISDTLFKKELDLEKKGETEIVVPDSILPRANFQYLLYVLLKRTDNEWKEESKTISYFYHREKIQWELAEDSLKISKLENKEEVKAQAVVLGQYKGGKSKEVYRGELPAKLVMNPIFISYQVQTDGYLENYKIKNESSGISCESQRTSDSLFLSISNPRKLLFSYHLYAHNREIERGYSEEFELKMKAHPAKNYYLSIQYLWGGSSEEKNYRFPFDNKALKLEVNHPKLIVPGQKAEIELLVKDVDGNAVSGVDIAAFGLTKKFDYQAPILPDFKKKEKQKEQINLFHLNDFRKASGQITLKKAELREMLGVDSIPYFSFLFPDYKIFRFEYEGSSQETQFAPFVLKNGEFQDIHVIYIDSRPVYFSWSDNYRPYSFRLSPGYHDISLRTSYDEIYLDSVFIPRGKKLILSLDLAKLAPGLRRSERIPFLFPNEKRTLYPYIFPFRYTFGDDFTYLKNKESFQLLSIPSSTSAKPSMIGPVRGELELYREGDKVAQFRHEDYFEYDMREGLVKMRHFKHENKYPNSLQDYHSSRSLEDLAFNPAMLRTMLFEIWKKQRIREKRYAYPTSTNPGNGQLQVGFGSASKKPQEPPLNVLVSGIENVEFFRVYPGSMRVFHDLPPAYYRLSLIFTEGKYQTFDSLKIEANGLNYYSLIQGDSLKSDVFGKELNEILRKHYSSPIKTKEQEIEELQEINRNYIDKYSYQGPVKKVFGYVKDDYDGSPLIGATVRVKNTVMGTITDINGYFELEVPLSKKQIIISYIGYQNLTTSVSNESYFDIELKQDHSSLEEVVVVGYGSIKNNKALGYSVSTITSESLDNYTEYEIATMLRGKASGVEIVQTSGLAGGGHKILIRGYSLLAESKNPLIIIDGIPYSGNLEELDEGIIQKMEVLKSETAASIYGSMASGGAILISTKSGEFSLPSDLEKGALFEDEFIQAAEQSSGLRSNFSDYAFWQPALTTDKEGKAVFEVEFPDDISSWDTHFIAVGSSGRATAHSGNIKSYKPLLARLSTPRFLVEGDSTNLIGQAVNYLPDSVKIQTQFVLGSDTLVTKDNWLKDVFIDSLALIAGKDSITTSFILNSSKMKDGERRIIPTFRRGIAETIGKFAILEGDSSLEMSFDPQYGEVRLYAKADALDIMKEELKNLIRYPYNCNEQMASRLKALVLEQRIADSLAIKVSSSKQIKRLIGKLVKNQNDAGLWGWWGKSTENFWVSAHVLDALLLAKKDGFKIPNIFGVDLKRNLRLQYEASSDVSRKIQLLELLSKIGASGNFYTEIGELEKKGGLTKRQKLSLFKLRKENFLPIPVDSIIQQLDTTLLGGIYFPRDKMGHRLWQSEIQNSLLAYQILEGNERVDKGVLTGMRNYFLANRKNYGWRNTYESIRIVETILPSLLQGKKEITAPVLQLAGATDSLISNFPAEMTLNPSENLKLVKTGSFPLYLSLSQTRWEANPEAVENDFVVKSSFDSGAISQLTAGEKETLRLKLEVKKRAEYVMISVPIPASCSYAQKPQRFPKEVHREYFKDRVAIFCEKLEPGSYEFLVELMPRYTGRFSLNPAKVELMYFPTFSANNVIKEIRVK
ncbi:MAG: carboxypeptidase-like regulatory domain-containing protein [Bacteroidia bacterium]|nr:carboxypeptidase-like regulatory domain-containing protein [Bacteroidia bacterium]